MKTLKRGDVAPDFEFKRPDGRMEKLSDLKGKRIILYFYPKDDTPGCTAQACNLRDEYSVFQKAGIEVIGVSADTDQKHDKFREKYSLPFPLVADVNREVIDAFGVWGEKKFMGKVYDGIHRITFVIDEKGKIMHVIDKVKTKAHAEQIKELLNL